MTAATVTLGGVPLTAVTRASWAFTAGVRPYMRVFETSAASADLILLRQGVPTTLVIDAPGCEKLEVKNLIVIEARPGSTPHTKGVLVADRRYLWRRKWIVRDFNMRRRTGEQRLVGEGRIENARLAPDVAYAPFSLEKGTTPFNAGTALRDVLKEVDPDGIVYEVGDTDRAIEVEDLTLNEPGDVAVERVLAYVAGWNCRPDAEGRIIVYDSRDGSEKGEVEKAGTVLSGTGYYGPVDRSYARGKKVHVLFERECELRFDFTPGATVDKTDRWMVNVIPCPDPFLTVNGKTVGAGSILDFTDYLPAVAATGDYTQTNAATLGALTEAHIRTYYLGMWTRLINSLYGSILGTGTSHPLWIKRLSSIKKHWRITYQINPHWLSRIRSMRPYRVAVLGNDFENSLPGKAEAYMDYLVKPSKASYALKAGTPGADIGRQVSGWAATLANVTSGPAPADVSIPDEQAGIVRVWLVRDPWGEGEEIAPGNVATLPSEAVEPTIRKAAAAGVVRTWANTPLKESFKCAVIFTVVQAAPNGQGRMHRVTVTPAQAAETLGLPIGDCEGDEVTIAIGGGLQTARFKWLDSQAAEIEKAFFDDTGSTQMPEVLLVNKESIDAIARATAAREYASRLDRVQGQFAVRLNPEVKVTGAISSVEHAIAPNGAATTTITLAPEVEAPDFWSLVPAAAQRIIRRMVQE